MARGEKTASNHAQTQLESVDHRVTCKPRRRRDCVGTADAAGASRRTAVACSPGYRESYRARSDRSSADEPSLTLGRHFAVVARRATDDHRLEPARSPGT